MFPSIPHPALAQILNVVDQFRQFERLSVAEQRQRQLINLRGLLRHAWRYSPFWQARLRAAGFRPEEGSDMSAFARLPILTRAELQENAEAIRAHSPEMTAQTLSTARSSGSTGRPVAVERYTPTYRPLYQAMSLLENYWHGRDGSQPLAVVKDMPDGTQPHWGPLFQMLGKTGPSHIRNLLKHPPEDIAAWLLDLRPPYLLTTPAMAGRLAELVEGELSLRQIITFGETVTPELRALAERAFGARIADRYSCEELGWVALQCPKHAHYHALSALLLVEIVDDAGRPCGPGVPGRVLLTGLHGFAMPLIRYDIGDVAEWGAPCDCGINLPVIGRLWGRQRSFLQRPDGSLYLAPLTGEYWRKVAPIREHRLVQYADGLIEAFVAPERPLTEGERAAIRAMLHRELHFAYDIIVTEADGIDWGAQWKRVDVIRLDRLRDAPPVAQT